MPAAFCLPAMPADNDNRRDNDHNQDNDNENQLRSSLHCCLQLNLRFACDGIEELEFSGEG